MKHRKYRLFLLLFCIPLLLACMTWPAHADTGPKPSVVVNILGLDGRTCYATLLSTTDSTGPHTSRWNESSDGSRIRNYNIAYGCQPDDPEYSICRAFSDYEEQDPEGLFFLQYFSDCTQGQFRWGYYPPAEFKLLLYFPETDSFVLGDSFLERYAFDSYYTADLTGIDLDPGGVVSGLAAEKSYDYTWELVSLAARVVLTIAVELLMALPFRLTGKGQLRIILLVNLVTQIVLNGALNWYAHFNGSGFLILPYLMMELAVVIVENAAYFLWLPVEAADRRERSKLTGSYTLAANACSLVVGWALAHAIPGLF